MDWDDIVYILLLLFSIGFGVVYRQIKDEYQRKVTGTVVGLGLVILVSGYHVLHVLVFTMINMLIIQLMRKKNCHLISFAFSFTYLLFFRTTVYFGIPYAPAHTNLVIMVLTLKLVGLAFEVHSSYTQQQTSKHEDLNEEQIAEREFKTIDPSSVEMVHYVFNYVGVLTGPYYTYRSYHDSFHINASKFALCNAATFKKLTYVPMYALLFLTVSSLCPFSYALDDEFYNERSFWFRAWYCIPNFFIFRMRIYIGITLSECVCSMVGLGAYPARSEPRPGAGPTKHFLYLRELGGGGDSDGDGDVYEQYNFETIHNIDPYEVELCTTFRDTMKHWNMCVQWWLAVNVYKRFPSRRWRTFATLLVSAVWHGVYIGHYFTICGAPVYLPVEDLYVKLLPSGCTSHGKWRWLVWLCKMLSLSYLAFAFHLLTVPRVLRYYNSIYHVGLVAYALLYVLGLIVRSDRKRMRKQMD